MGCSFFLLTEKGFRKHQCPFGVGYEIRQILLGLQTNVENVAPRQSQIGHHCQQYTTIEVNDYVRLLRSSVFFNTMRKKLPIDTWTIQFETIWSCDSVTEKYVFNVIG